MANYQVNYTINVVDKGTQAITNFQSAVASLNIQPLQSLQRLLTPLNRDLTTLSKLGKITVNVKIGGSSANQINEKAAAIERLNKAMANNKGRQLTSGTVGGRGSGGSTPRTTVAAASTRVPSRVMAGLPYKLLGPTPLPNNGGMAIDMLKGMGIAYGIAGLGSLVSSVVNQATEYDNIIKTVENILKSHDNKGNFAGRFGAMTRTIRNVGMETKFKVTEVADAAKFLAMAGLDVEAINAAIRPIADIALVGDTDLGQTADLVTNIMTAYNIAPSRMRNAADVMTNTFTMTNTTLTEIAEAYKYAASLLSAGGVDFNEATAAIGVLGDAGIKGSQAGTTMRTIMANLVNPTKKQQKAWDATGIKRFDSQGNLRPLVEIFKDLNAADLSVDYYYKMFHRTAASGAVALTAHVDKWNNVILENFMSGGLSKKLADEKKNTIQGLWAQITSIFVDQGVNAFNGVQSRIRELMGKAIDVLKDENGQYGTAETFEKIAKVIMEFFGTLKNATQFFMEFYKLFGPFIKLWMQFQIVIWPVTKALAAFRSVFLGLMGLRGAAITISALAGSFTKLGKSAIFARQSIMGGGMGAGVRGAAAGALMTPYGFAAGAPWLPQLSFFDMKHAARGLHLDAPKMVAPTVSSPWNLPTAMWVDEQNMQRYKADRKLFHRRIFMKQLYAGAAVPFAGVAGMMGLHEFMREDGNGWDTAAATLYGLGAMSSMFGAPGLAIGAGLAGLGALFQFVIGANVRKNEMVQKILDLNSNLAVEDGRLIDTKGSDVIRWLDLIHDKHKNIDDIIQLKIKHTRELLGLESAPESKTDIEAALFGEVMKQGLGQSGIYKYIDGNKELMEASGLRMFDVGGKHYRVFLDNMGGTSAMFSADEAEKRIAAWQEFSNGSYVKQLADDYAKASAKAVASGDFEALLTLAKNFERDFGSSHWGGDKWKEALPDDDAVKANPALLYNHPFFKALIYRKYASDFGLDNNSMSVYSDFHESLTGNSDNLLDKFADFAEHTNLPSLSLVGLNPNDDVNGWFKKIGWDEENKQFIPLEKNLTAADQAQTILDQIRVLNQIASKYDLRGLGNERLNAAFELIDYLGLNAQGLLAIKNGTALPANWTPSDGFKVVGQDSQLYQYNAATKMWDAIEETAGASLAAFSAPGSSFLNSFEGMGYLAATGFGNSFAQTLAQPNVGENAENGTPIAGAFGLGLNSFFSNNLGLSYSIGSQWGSNYGLSAYGGFMSSFTNTLYSLDSTGLLGGSDFKPNSFLGASMANGKGTRYRVTGSVAKPFGSGSGKSAATPYMYGGSAGEDSNDSSSTPTGINLPKTSQTDYDTKYKRHTSTPKQINVKIENLMNVEKIDLSNPDNVMVINNLKEQLAQALVDVVADTDLMLGNFTA